MRQAARLVLNELAGAARALDRAAMTQSVWDGDDLSSDGWNEYRPELAASLPQEQWRLLAAAYDEIESANANARMTRREREAKGYLVVGPSGRWDDYTAPPVWLRDAHRAVRLAMESVERYTGPHAGVFTYTGHVGIEEIEEQWPS